MSSASCAACAAESAVEGGTGARFEAETAEVAAARVLDWRVASVAVTSADFLLGSGRSVRSAEQSRRGEGSSLLDGGGLSSAQVDLALHHGFERLAGLVEGTG